MMEPPSTIGDGLGAAVGGGVGLIDVGGRWVTGGGQHLLRVQKQGAADLFESW